MSDERKRCGELSGKLNKKGNPCEAYARKGKTTCIGHADKKEQEQAGFGGSQPNAGRPRLPSTTELMRKVVEENVEKILAPHFKVLGYDLKIDGENISLEPREGGGAKLFGESKDGIIKVSGFDDLAAMVAVAEKLFDRALGRPKQATELSGPGGGPIDLDVVSVPTDEEFHRGVAGILAAAGAVDGAGD